jgi:ferric-dicitrate binding protein FerR (iron transport regulator)
MLFNVGIMGDELNSLINKYLEGTLRGDERVKMETWLNQVHLSKEVVPDWHDDDKERNWAVILDQLDLSSALPPSGSGTSDRGKSGDNRYNARKSAREKQNMLLPLLWAAALLTALFPAAVALLEWKEPVHILTVSRSGKVILPDGTLVWLRDDTQLKYPSRFDNDQREVFLTGEALFEVVRNPSLPFVIRCEEYTAKVLGTSFSIRSTPSDMEVVVLTGMVSIGPTEASAFNAVTVLHPNERAVFSRGARVVSTVPVEINERSKIVANTSYDMRFGDTPMEKVVMKIQDKFDVDISFENPGIATCRISADFTDQPLDATLNMICEALELTYARKGSAVVIKGQPCSN